MERELLDQAEEAHTLPLHSEQSGLDLSIPQSEHGV